MLNERSKIPSQIGDKQKRTAMIWPRVKEGRVRYHQEDDKYAGGGKEKKGRIPPRRCLSMQVQGKRRRGGYHQQDVKYAGAGKEKTGRIPPTRC